MNFNYRYFNLFSFVLTLTFLSSTALFCSDLASINDKDTPCFLEPPTRNPVILSTSSNSLVLPCHVARSKRSTVEWWYTDAQKLINIKIFPVLPAVRPTVLRFVTSVSSSSKTSKQTDITDATILLRHVNVDDSGTYRCIIRPWTMDPITYIENTLLSEDSNATTLSYQVQLTGPRLCQSSPGRLPCFSAMRTTSPTIVDAYETAFLPCVVNNFDRPASVFWVVGNASINSVLITNHLPKNQYNGDQLNRVFPLSPFDYSIEISVNRDTYERVYSCVIDGATDAETTLFTYIVHTINLEEVVDTNGNGEKIVPHDALNPQQIDSLRKDKKVKINEEDLNEEEDLFGADRREESEETSTMI